MLKINLHLNNIWIDIFVKRQYNNAETSYG
jgi:hypothetical protein